MATDGPTPPSCDKAIFKKGRPVAAIEGSSNAVEHWVRTVAKKANAKVDWHYSGGIANVLHLGDDKSRTRVEAAITELAPTLKGRIIRRYQTGESGLFREGVTQTPPKTIAAFIDPLSDKTTYIVK